MIASASQDRFIRLWRLTYSGMNNNNSDDGSGRNKKTSEEGKEADDDDGNNAVLNAFINGDL